MDIELKEKEEEKRKEEERRARIARKNCKLININLKKKVITIVKIRTNKKEEKTIKA